LALTDKIKDFVNVDKHLNGILNTDTGKFLRNNIPLINSYVLAQQYLVMNAKLSSLWYRAQKIFLWNLSGHNYDNLSPEKAFIPSFYGKVNITTNPTPRNTKILKIPKEINKSIQEGASFENLKSLADEDRNVDGPNRLFIYIKYKNNADTWTLLKLRATIGDKELIDTFNNSWTPHSAFGRTQKNYIYSETERILPLSLFEYAYSRNELLSFYKRIDALAKLNYGKINNISDNLLERGTIIYLTIGNLFVDIPCIIQTMSFEWDSNNWDIEYFVPTRVKINMGLIVIHSENKHLGSDFYYNNIFEENKYKNNPIPQLPDAFEPVPETKVDENGNIIYDGDVA
jgi:hypothetical protein